MLYYLATLLLNCTHVQCFSLTNRSFEFELQISKPDENGQVHLKKKRRQVCEVLGQPKQNHKVDMVS